MFVSPKFLSKMADQLRPLLLKPLGQLHQTARVGVASSAYCFGAAEMAHTLGDPHASANQRAQALNETLLTAMCLLAICELNSPGSVMARDDNITQLMKPN
jgi:hypothetical protein